MPRRLHLPRNARRCLFTRSLGGGFRPMMLGVETSLKTLWGRHPRND
ncbi:hypothetical protein ACFOD4_10465 [Pseudoroseomonas globiformis]|uniref:Uncharacterized protein n=1 Tax=Teichococcus globiformis TaxID=2307229 RepID=A0ABV7G2W6_9PROT